MFWGSVILVIAAQNSCTFGGGGELLEVTLVFEVKSSNSTIVKTHICVYWVSYVFSAAFKRPLLLPVKLPGIIATHIQSPRWKHCSWIMPLTEPVMDSKLNWVVRLNFVWLGGSFSWHYLLFFCLLMASVLKKKNKNKLVSVVIRLLKINAANSENASRAVSHEANMDIVT